MDQPATDAGAAVRMLAGRLEGALQHVSTHTAEKTFIHIAHKPVQIIAHPADARKDHTNMAWNELKTKKKKKNHKSNIILIYVLQKIH